MNAIPFGTMIIAPAAYAVPSAAGLVHGLKQASANVAIVPPSILEELCHNTELLDNCAGHLEAMIYSGGHLPQNIGSIVASRMRLLNQYGSTELGLTPLILSQSNRCSEDWKYMQLHPHLGFEFRPFTQGVSELYIVRRRSLEHHQLTFTYSAFADLEEYATGDLFIRHPIPEKQNFWEWYARRDDIIVLLNGEKVNPTEMEQHITLKNPEIKGALVTGDQRFQTMLLLEPTDEWRKASGSQNHSLLLDKLWPSIEEANRLFPAYAPIAESHILFTDWSMPMIRSGKGAIRRAATVELYTEQFDSLYNELEFPKNSSTAHSLTGDGISLDQCDVTCRIREIIKSVAGMSDLDENDNLFLHGMDSFQTLAIVREMKNSLDIKHLSAAFVYSHPSISRLAHALTQPQHVAPENYQDRQAILDH